MNQAILDVHQQQQIQNQNFFDQIEFSNDMNHNIMDALYYILLQIQNIQHQYALNLIIIMVADGFDHSRHGIDELIAMIKFQRNATIIIGQFQTQEPENQAFQLQAQLQTALPMQVKIIKSLRYEQITHYCTFYQDSQVNIIFGMSNLKYMQRHIQKVCTLFGSIISRYNISKLYLINSQILKINYYENFIPIKEVTQNSSRLTTGQICFRAFVTCLIILTIVFFINVAIIISRQPSH